jgi:hypothetical protein
MYEKGETISTHSFIFGTTTASVRVQSTNEAIRGRNGAMAARKDSFLVPS